MEHKYKKSKEYFGSLGDSESDWVDNTRSEFKDGTEYLEWLERQLPYIEEFEASDADHYYFFRSWSKQRSYFPEMEPLIEIEEEESISLTHDYADGAVKETEKVWENGTKPEFKDGRQLVEWLERKLSYLEPFAPEDAVHYYFNRQWSRQKSELKLEVLVEDDHENENENIDHFNHGDDKSLKNKDDRNPYIKMMASPLVLEGFNFKKSEPHGDDTAKNATKEKDTPKMQFTNGCDSLIGELMLSGVKIAKIQSKLHPLLQKKNKEKRDHFTEEKKKAKTETKKTMFSFFRHVFG
ncbi:uncharacterized protein LOC134237608 isoform X1 [Saccostrea cucullata]|uniref:uncharacterized protein LOC134237608 isoform X1 n=1 Tax=Saccostrea cuccullata TaxID=36930 RepID=UPI002ED3BAE1